MNEEKAPPQPKETYILTKLSESNKIAKYL